MTRNPPLHPTRAPRDRSDLFASLRRIAITAAAGFSALFLIAALFFK